jgi:hypothetical protein
MVLKLIGQETMMFLSRLKTSYYCLMLILIVTISGCSLFKTAEQTPSQPLIPREVIIPSYLDMPSKLSLEVKLAAMKGLKPFLDALPPEYYSRYGFISNRKVSRVSLGEPFQIHTITPDKINAYDPKEDIFSVISSKNIWLFPVLAEEKAQMLLTVARVKGRWKAVALGSAGLARQLDYIILSCPSAKGYEYTFLRIYEAKADFIVLKRNDDIKIKPLSSAILSLKLKRTPMLDSSPRLKPPLTSNCDHLYEPSYIMKKLKTIIQQLGRFRS